MPDATHPSGEDRGSDRGRAVALLKVSLSLLRESGDKPHTSRNLECLAARLFGAGEALREAIGAPVLFYLIDYDGAVSATRDALGVEAFMAAWDEGRAMTLEEAIIHALEEPATQEEGELTRRAPARGTSAAEDDAFPGSYPDGLTAREAEVLRLLAEGRTNKQIAAELFLSVSTVQRHVANVYTKIGAHRRAQATAYALSKGLARTRPEQDLRSTTEPPG
jgi:DNA-binding NarL/FixJ family response regulator